MALTDLKSILKKPKTLLSLGLLLLLVLGLGAGLYLSQTKQELRKSAAGTVDLELVSSKPNPGFGEKFMVNVILKSNQGTYLFDAADIVMYINKDQYPLCKDINCGDLITEGGNIEVKTYTYPSGLPSYNFLAFYNLHINKVSDYYDSKLIVLSLVSTEPSKAVKIQLNGSVVIATLYLKRQTYNGGQPISIDRERTNIANGGQNVINNINAPSFANLAAAGKDLDFGDQTVSNASGFGEASHQKAGDGQGHQNLMLGATRSYETATNPDNKQDENDGLTINGTLLTNQTLRPGQTYNDFKIKVKTPQAGDFRGGARVSFWVDWRHGKGVQPVLNAASVGGWQSSPKGEFEATFPLTVPADASTTEPIFARARAGYYIVWPQQGMPVASHFVSGGEVEDYVFHVRPPGVPPVACLKLNERCSIEGQQCCQGLTCQSKQVAGETVNICQRPRPAACNFDVKVEVRDEGNNVYRDRSGFGWKNDLGQTGSFPSSGPTRIEWHPRPLPEARRGDVNWVELTLPTTPLPAAQRITGTFCEGTGCPAGIGGANARIEGLTTDCGLNYTYGWVVD